MTMRFVVVDDGASFTVAESSTDDRVLVMVDAVRTRTLDTPKDMVVLELAPAAAAALIADLQSVTAELFGSLEQMAARPGEGDDGG